MYEEIIKNAIDLHVHVGPEIIPRKYTVADLVHAEKEKMKGIGVKNHCFPTAAMGNQDTENSDNPFITNSITLNHYLGGFNAAAVRASAELSSRPIIVWFPTIHAANALQQQTKEIPVEWLALETRKRLQLRQANSIPGLTVVDGNGAIKPEVREVLEAIKENDCILATGHLSWQESKKLVSFAMSEMGIKRVIVTHPIYQKIQMPLEVQKELSQLGAYMEQCFSMYSIDEIPIQEITNQIKALGAENCILSSDVGQAFSKTPSVALEEFFALLNKEGISKQDITAMAVDNPQKLTTLKR